MNDPKMANPLGPKETKHSITELVTKYRPDMAYYENFYRNLHSKPELSLQEKTTALVITSYLRGLGYLEIRTNIGGYGVVGILRNGIGKTVLLRAELDALPLEEQTGLEFASTKRMIDIIDGVEKPVMHACGHDMHISSLLAASELLFACRAHWKGTLLILFQPNEEHGAGAQAMVSDGLYDPDKHAIPKPDIVLGGHVIPDRVGRLGTRKGVCGSAANSYRVVLHGRGAHGSRPHMSIDPIVMASSAVLKLQTIVSRTTNPQEPVVLTVGAIHSGDAPNIIPATATLLLNTRTFSRTSRDHVLASITRILNAEALAFNAPRLPSIEEIGSFPLLTNDDFVTQTVIDAFAAHFGTDNVNPNAPISMGSEDFANLSDPVGAPGCFWSYGGVEAAVWDEAEKNGRLGEIPGRKFFVLF
jgi:amidohydrolase